MDNHRFYVEQAKNRLLSQFDNIEAEANEEAEAYQRKMSDRFGSAESDPSRFVDAANNAGIEFYQLLSEMHDATRQSVIAGMFYQWDKELRDWICEEIHHDHRGENVDVAIWKANFPEILELLKACNFEVAALRCYNRLDAMRQVVNVFKHGNGSSLDSLKQSFPEFISYPSIFDGAPDVFRQNIDHTYVKLTDEHLTQFSEAILEFWTSFPADILLPQKSSLPTWLEKAYRKDRPPP